MPGMPYRVYGGLRFFERAEIKDALAYLRLISHREDDTSFERIVNRPTRGIGAQERSRAMRNVRAGQRLLNVARSRCHRQRGSRWQGCKLRSVRFSQSDRTHGARHRRASTSQDQVDHVIHASGLDRVLPAKKKANAVKRRIENLDGTRQRRKELRARSRGRDDSTGCVPVARCARSRRRPGRGMGGLRAIDDHAFREGPRVPARFPLRHGRRFVPTPAFRIADANGLEEERRLCYVGITRAKQTALCDLRRTAAAARYGQLLATIAIHRRNTPRNLSRKSGPACSGQRVRCSPSGLHRASFRRQHLVRAARCRCATWTTCTSWQIR